MDADARKAMMLVAEVRRLRALLAEALPLIGSRTCAHCRRRAATCVGQYEGVEKPSAACDTCCGHGCEDGQCVDIDVLALDLAARVAASLVDA